MNVITSVHLPAMMYHAENNVTTQNTNNVGYSATLMQITSKTDYN